MDPFEKATQLTAQFLSFRPRSEYEIRQHLKKKQIEDSVIEKTLFLFIKNKFIDDKKFITWWIDQRLSFRPMSIRLISIELKKKGISQELITRTLEEIKKEEVIPANDLTQAERIVIQKIKKYQSLPKKEQFNKLAGILLRRGFSYDTIKKAIQKYTSSAQNRED